MDAIVEVDMSGNIVWEWCFFDHIVQDYRRQQAELRGRGKTIADYPGQAEHQSDGHPLKSDWLHCNSLDYNQILDQIVINAVQGEFYVIDHGNTFIAGNPAGSIALAAASTRGFPLSLRRPRTVCAGQQAVGPDGLDPIDHGNKQVGGAHRYPWIGRGLVGAGHFLIFNNAQYLSEHTPQSYVLEINPFLDSSGTNTGIT